MSFLRSDSSSSRVEKRRSLLTYGAVFMLLWLGSMCWSHPQALGAKRNARQEFNLARQYFERGKLQESVKVLKRLLKRYPKNKAAYHLLGRIYYRGGRVKAAARFFARSDGDFLYTGGAFEYGIAMFSVGRCAKAMDGFKRVSAKSTMKDLARFYSGVCHFRARRWYPAESELLRANRLPANLLATRQKFLQEIQRKKQEERLGQFAQATPYQPVPIPFAGQSSFSESAGVPGLPAGPGAPTPDELLLEDESQSKAKDAAEAPQITKGLSWNVTPTLEYKNISETYQRHQASTNTIVTTGPRAAANLQGRFDFAPDAKGRQMAMMGNFRADFISYDVSEKDIAVEIDTSGQKSETATGAESTDRSLTLEGKPALSVPFGESLTIEGGGIYREIWPEMEAERKEVQMGPFGSFSITLLTVNLNVSGELLQKTKLNSDNVPFDTQDTKISGGINAPLPWYEISLNLGASYMESSNADYATLDGFLNTQSFSGGLSRAWETFTLAATVTQTTNTPPPGEIISGTADELKVVGEVSKTLKIGATLKLFGEFAQINQYNKLNLCETDKEGFFDPDCGENEQRNATAIGERQGFGVSLKLMPVDWAYASAAYSYSSTIFNVEQKELISHFQAKVSDQVETITLLIGLTHTF